MSGQYVFELQFKGKSDGPNFKPKETQFYVVDEESMQHLSKFQADLSKCTPELYKLQYIDDEDDIISIDTEDEFKEFVKLAKYRSSRGLLIRLIINSDILGDVSDQNTVHTQTPAPKKNCVLQKLKALEIQDCNHGGRKAVNETFTQEEMEEAIALQEYTDQETVEAETKRIASPQYEHLFNDAMFKEVGLSELKKKLKSELKKEILFEMRNEMKTASSALLEDPEVEEDSDGGIVNLRDKRRIKLLNCQKKLEKKEKHYETKIDLRLEKLEMKKKKMLEKASLRTAGNRKAMVETKIDLPFIMSALQTNESATLGKRVTVGKVFLHAWHVINDGTVAWTNVELRHFWSSVGLEPDELSVKCPPVSPGQEGHLTMKFKAPKTVGSFVSYWHLFYQVDSQWQQFGHYVSLSGNTKPSKHAALAAPPKDVIRKSKQDTRAVTFNEDASASGLNEVTVKDDPKVVCRFKKEANLHHRVNLLASSEIAAEMAREAANAAFRLANGKETCVSSTPNGLDKLNDTSDVAVEFVQLLNVVDSGSDTEANNDTNEETDPGFVMVDVPTCFYTDERNQQPEKIPVNVSEDSSAVLKEINKIPIAKDVEKNTEVLKTEKKDERLIHDKIYEKPCQPNEENNKNVQESCYSENEEREQADPAYENIEERQLPISFPNVNYSVFPTRVPIPPLGVYSTQQPIPHHHAPHGYPVFPAQNSSSHVVFPPPINYFTTPKINPPVHYPQIPTYPPMSGCSHPIPLISTGLPPPSAIPAQSTMAPPPQLTPPQINPAPIPQQMPFAMPPVIMRYGNHHAQTTPAASVKYEPKFPSANAVTSVYSSTSARTNHIVESFPEKTASSAESSFTAGTKTQELRTVQEKTQADAGVQILPQSLVNGAINVATTAYSTARNALNNLRPKDGSIEFDPVFENHMALLVDMGFNNLERNGRLLKKYNNDVTRVISVICAYDTGDSSLGD